jgi:hypothetical protein
VISCKGIGLNLYSGENSVCIEIADHYLIGSSSKDGVLIKEYNMVNIGHYPLDRR